MSKHKNHHEKEMVTASEEQEVLKEENTNQEVPVKEKECKCSKEKEKTIELQKELEESKKQIEVLNQKIGSMQEALLRNQAELQNYKRRKEEESEKVLKYKN